MITAETFLRQAKFKGFDFFTGVPCSFLTPLINGVLNDTDTEYVAAASEGEASPSLAAATYSVSVSFKTPLINGVRNEHGTPVKKSNPLNFAWRRNVSAVITGIYPLS